MPSKNKNSSGDMSRKNPYTKQGVEMYGREGWTTSEIKRNPKTGEVSVKIKPCVP